MSKETPKAVVREQNGELVLDDPDALAVFRAVAMLNCKMLLRANRQRVDHFLERMMILGAGAEDVVIVLIAVDDPNGRPLADILMPDEDWQKYRDQGAEPIARGLVSRLGIEMALDMMAPHAADKLRDFEGVAIAVVAHGIADIFGTSDLEPNELR